MSGFRTKLAIIVATVAVVALAAWWLTRPAPADTRFSGAYRLPDGELVIVTPREGDVLRYRVAGTGESRALWPAGEGHYTAGPGWADPEPVEVEVRFERGDHDDDGVTGLAWSHPARGEESARRLPLEERLFTFESDGLELRGKLVTPAGAPPGATPPGAPGGPPFPAVVIVHGSGAESAVDHYFYPYLFAARGLATVAFDKRGTGGSEGAYTQNFPVLAGDVAAAVEWLRGQPEIDASRILLAGFSQGGWIAPLAATLDGGVAGVAVGYGPMVPITGEDRWGYVHALREAGMGEEEIAAADEVNAVIEAIVDRGEDRWAELDRRLEEAEGEPWLEAVAGSDSILGAIADSPWPLWVFRVYAWWRFGSEGLGGEGEEAYALRTWDPVPTVAPLEIPSLWIFGGEDSSMPSGWSIAELRRLQEAGRPIRVAVFPEAEHGILRFAEEGGERRLLGYEPRYLATLVGWLRRAGGLERPAAGGLAEPRVRLTGHPAADRSPAWSPDGGRIAFESDRDGNWELYLLEPDGEGLRRLTDDPAADRFPAWDPAGERLVFHSDRSGTPELHVLELATGEVRRLTELPGVELFPDWSPDGRWVAFSRAAADGAMDLYRVPAAGGPAEELAASPERDVWPRFSPAGERLAFFSRRDTGGVADDVYVLDLEGGAVQRVTRAVGHDFCPAWAPDGERLAVARSGEGEPRRLEVVDLEGRVLAELGRGAERITEPSWSPDGRWIAVAGRDGEGEEYDVWLLPVPASAAP